MRFPLISIFRDEVNAISVRLSQCNAAEALTSELLLRYRTNILKIINIQYFT